ncbi:hypothetical protein C8R45DRAFT_640498 [Mycena sanguinolenta]|nr:hypothetical protein C8R45DRAFT_640498 [Mycena sanguinolenta]
MFSRSRHFTVKGQNLTNITNNYATPSVPPDFRMIPMGDIDLQYQIRLEQIQVDECTGVVNAQPHKRACVRRMHSAKARIDGRKSRVTVAIYQGNDAEEVNGARTLPNICLCDIRILCRSVPLQGQMVYMPHFSMTISYRSSNFWIVIEILIFRRYIFMLTGSKIFRTH